MKIKSLSLAIITLSVFVVGIGLSMTFNLWQTESEKAPVKFSSGEFEGMSNPADIKGSYSFNDIETNFEISVDTLARAFGVSDENPGAFQAKELGELYQVQDDGGEVGTDSLKLFVARYTGLPYTPEESTRLPSSAISVLKDKLSIADLEALKKISVELQLLKTEDSIDPAEIIEHVESLETEIRGNTTFGDLLDWGLSKEQIENAMGMEMGAVGISIRDFAVEKEIEFSELKTAFQELLDTIN